MKKNSKLKPLLSRFRRIFFYKNYDSNAYWKTRARFEDQAAVLWENQEYNQLYRSEQKLIIFNYLNKIKNDSHVLDIGCGVGVVAQIIAENFKTFKIDAVDFYEMIEIASKKNQSSRINYISCSAEDYIIESESYDVIISSACFSSIRNIENLEKAMLNSVKMLKPGGLILMIDPFHRWSYLARARYNSRDVINFMKRKNIFMLEKSGVLFWPFRDFLANSKLTGGRLKWWFDLGEKILRLLGKHFWSDYKILVFVKKIT